MTDLNTAVSTPSLFVKTSCDPKRRLSVGQLTQSGIIAEELQLLEVSGRAAISTALVYLDAESLFRLLPSSRTCLG